MVIKNSPTNLLKIHHQTLSVFYMDIQNFGKNFLPLYEEAKKTLTLIRGIPGSINPAPGERISLGFQTEGGGPPQEEFFDLLVLSIGLMPSEINRAWAELFQIPLNRDGFLARKDPRGTPRQAPGREVPPGHHGLACRRAAPGRPGQEGLSPHRRFRRQGARRKVLRPLGARAHRG